MPKKKSPLKSDKSIIKRAKKIAIGIGIMTSMVVTASVVPTENNEKDENNLSLGKLKQTIKNIVGIDTVHAGHANISGHNSSFGNSSGQKRGYHYSVGTHGNHDSHASHSSHSSY